MAAEACGIRRRSVTPWILAVSLGPLALAISAGVGQAGRHREQLSARVEATGDALLEVVADLVARRPDGFRTDALQPVVFRFGRSLPVVQRVTVIDRSLRILADTEPARVGQPTDLRALAEALQQPVPRRAAFRRGGLRFLRVCRPLLGPYDPMAKSAILGAVAIELRAWPVDARVPWEALRLAAAGCGAVGLLGWLILCVIRRRLVGPLRLIASAIERFSHDASARAEVPADRDVATVAEAFNQTASTLLSQLADSRRTAEALRVSQERFKSLVESNVIGIMVVGKDGRILEANDALLALAGYSREDLQEGRLGWDQMTPAEYQPLDQLALEKLRKGQPCPPWEKECLRKDGGRVPVLVGLARLAGSADSHLWFVVDLTQRRRVESERTRLAALVESSEDAIVGVSLDGTILSWNHGAERMLGYAAAEAIGRPLTLVVPPDRRAEIPQLLERAKRGERVAAVETVRRRQNGQLIPVSLSLAPLRDEIGWVMGASTIARDITARKQAEQLKDELIHLVGHEVRNPLVAVKEGVALVVEGILGGTNEEQRETLSMVLEETNRLIQLTTDLLDLSKLEAGKIELKRERADVVEIAKRSCDLFAARARAKGLAVKLQAPAEPVEVLVDRGKITQVFTNLLSNALKFTPKGSITVTVVDKGPVAECGVLDTGVGIAKEDLPKVFGKFQQFDSALAPDEKGTGLGLAICKGLVEAHHGTIWVESQLGTGTAFLFTLQKAALKSA